MAKAKTTPDASNPGRLGRAFVLRVTDQGTRLDQAPDEHVFSARWIERALAAGWAKVTIELTPDAGDGAVYTLAGFDRVAEGSDQPNLTAWRARKGGKRG